MRHLGIFLAVLAASLVACQVQEDSVIVSLTTVPDRVDKLGPTLESLARQTVPVEVVVAIPNASKRFPEKTYYVPPWLERARAVTVIRCRDWGPATKLLGVLEQLVNHHGVIITVDDDTLYHPHMVENLLAYAKEFPNAALAHAGHLLFGPSIIMHDFHSVQFLRPPHHKRFYGQSVSEPVQADILHGYAGALYRRSFFDAAITNYNALGSAGDAAFFVDDDWISCHLARRNVDILLVPSPEPLLGRVAEVQSSALNEGAAKIVAQMQAQTLLLSACAERGWLTLRDIRTKQWHPNIHPPNELEQWSCTCPPPALATARTHCHASTAVRQFKTKLQSGAANKTQVASIMYPTSGTVLSCPAAVRAVTLQFRVELREEQGGDVIELRVDSTVIYSASYRWFRMESGGRGSLQLPFDLDEANMVLSGNEAIRLDASLWVAGEEVDSTEFVLEMQGDLYQASTGLHPNANAKCDRFYSAVHPRTNSEWMLPDNRGLYAAADGSGGVGEVLDAMVSDARAERAASGGGRGGEKMSFISLGATGGLWHALQRFGWEGETVGGGATDWEYGRVTWPGGISGGDVDLLWVDVEGAELFAWARMAGAVNALVVGIRFNALLPAERDWVATVPHEGKVEGWEGAVWVGASLLATVRVGDFLGYKLAHVGHRGGVAYFVRGDLEEGVQKRRGGGTAEDMAVSDMLDMARIVDCLDGNPAVYAWADSDEVLLRLEREQEQKAGRS